MSLAMTYSRAISGIDCPLVTVETHISNGLPRFLMVGLPDAAVRESKDRVRSAILNSQFDFPARRITVNLAPADLPKDGGRFDLAIALGILAASKQIPSNHLLDFEFAGELALSGELRPVFGALPFSIATAKTQKTLIISHQNVEEAALVESADLLPAQHLLEVCEHIKGGESLEPYSPSLPKTSLGNALDLADVYGQEQAKRAIEIAAAGEHSLLFLGPPGSGKTMLASRLPGLLPAMRHEEALELAAIESISGREFDFKKWKTRPFRTPHHTASSPALAGGGSPPKPGEISLAHHGVLFLDELPEFNRQVLEVLREPLESGSISISRAAHQVCFPAKFQLVAAMNPCPCGYFGDKNNECRCSPDRIRRYQEKISGPFLDRIDMHVHVAALPQEAIFGNKRKPSEKSAEVAKRVQKAWERQCKRQNAQNSSLNSQLLDKYAKLAEEEIDFMKEASKRIGFSARSYHRILRVARTIADLAEVDQIKKEHLQESLMMRCFDQK